MGRLPRGVRPMTRFRRTPERDARWLGSWSCGQDVCSVYPLEPPSCSARIPGRLDGPPFYGAPDSPQVMHESGPHCRPEAGRTSRRLCLARALARLLQMTKISVISVLQARLFSVLSQGLTDVLVGPLSFAFSLAEGRMGPSWVAVKGLKSGPQQRRPEKAHLCQRGE